MELELEGLAGIPIRPRGARGTPLLKGVPQSSLGPCRKSPQRTRGFLGGRRVGRSGAFAAGAEGAGEPDAAVLGLARGGKGR